MSTRILVVDDEFDTLELLRTFLELSDFDPITTLNSVEAVELAKATRPDVALLDIMMPELDGFTLCRMLRKDPATYDLPIIFVTAYEALDLEQRRREAGADDVIHKPIDLDALIASIHRVLRERATSTQTRPLSPIQDDGRARPGASNTSPSPAADGPKPPSPVHAPPPDDAAQS